MRGKVELAVIFWLSINLNVVLADCRFHISPHNHEQFNREPMSLCPKCLLYLRMFYEDQEKLLLTDECPRMSRDTGNLSYTKTVLGLSETNYGRSLRCSLFLLSMH